MSDIGILALISADSGRHRYHLASCVFTSRASSPSVFTRSLKKHVPLENDTCRLAAAFLLTRIDEFAINNNPANSQFGCESSAPGESPACIGAPLAGAAPKIRVRYGGGDVSAKRRKTQPRECYFNHRATKKKSHSENIYLLYRGKRRVQSWKRAP